ncbi:MAG: stress response translation initiation inhibitor YciH, partial [archaeon]
MSSMTEVCQICGLPKSICFCGKIAKESQKIRITVAKRRFKKFITTITGLEGKENAEELAKTLKKKLACGGTVKGTGIELQGAHKDAVKRILLEEGYT